MKVLLAGQPVDVGFYSTADAANWCLEQFREIVVEKVATGATIPVRAPLGYRLQSQPARTMPAHGLATLTVPVVRKHGWLRLKISVPFWVLILLIVVLIWDQLTAYYLYRNRQDNKGKA